VSLSTHVLDTERGRPAAGVRVELYRGDDRLAEQTTDDDGRISDLAPGIESGVFRLVFHPPSPFFRRVELEVELGDGHTHVPLLVSSYSCASYRGS
jgi:5-hydroxyisourate hydrolase